MNRYLAWAVITLIVLAVAGGVAGQDEQQPGSAINALAWSPSGQQLAVHYGSNVAACIPGYDFPSRLDLITISTGYVRSLIPFGHMCGVGGATFTYDGEYLLTRSYAGRIHTLDAETLEILGVLETMAFGSRMEASPSALQYTVTESGTAATMYELRHEAGRIDHHLSFAVMTSVNDHSGLINSVDWNPLGTMIITGSNDGTVAVWDIEQDSLIVRIYEQNEEPVKLVAWSPNPELIAFANQVGVINFWDLSHAERKHVIDAHSEIINVLDWSPDGTMLASASEDGTVRVWDGESGELIETFTYTGPVYALDWSPDGTKIAFGGANASGESPEVVIVDAPVWPSPLTPLPQGEGD
jgi:WD40 repeat protein